jgi:hypothetical protein
LAILACARRTSFHLLLALFLLVESGFSQVPDASHVEAVFLFRFTQFTDWPQDAFPTAQSPIVICVIGVNPFGDALQLAVEGEAVNGRSLTTRQLRQARDIDACNILFMSRSEGSRIPAILAALKDRSILTVSDADDFIEQGGMVQFINEDNHVRFRINGDAVSKAGLKLSAKLLQLAK